MLNKKTFHPFFAACVCAKWSTKMVREKKYSTLIRLSLRMLSFGITSTDIGASIAKICMFLKLFSQILEIVEQDVPRLEQCAFRESEGYGHSDLHAGS